MSRTGFTSIQQIEGITGPSSKMLLIDSVTQETVKVLFNPNKLVIDLQASIGSMSPIGSGHPIQQYSHTEAVKFDLEIYWSAIWGRQLGHSMHTNKLIGWLNSFLCPLTQHRAPAPLLIVWPHTLTMLVAVHSARNSYEKWFARTITKTADQAGIPRNVTITLNCSELRQDMRVASKMRQYGYARGCFRNQSGTAGSRA